MANLRACCCGYPETPCAGACDFDTSYAVSNLFIQLNYVFSKKTGSCSSCTNNFDGPNVDIDVSYSVTGTQSTPCIISKSKGRCCYKGGGQMGFTYNLQRPETYYCCVSDPTPVCTRDVPLIGTSGGVPFCYSVVCKPGVGTPFPNEASVWEHQLWICNFPLNRMALARLDPDECGTYDCNSVSLDRYMAMASGAIFRWYSKFKPLDTLGPGDISAVTICGDYAVLCGIIDLEDPDGLCPQVEAVTGGGVKRGPFSVYLIDDSITDAEPCTNFGGPYAYLDTWGCAQPYPTTFPYECSNNGESDCDGTGCLYSTFAYGCNFPYIS